MFSPKRSGAASPTSLPLKYSCMCSTTLPEEFSAGSTSTKRRVCTLSASLAIDHSIIRPYQTDGFRASGRTFLGVDDGEDLVAFGLNSQIAKLVP